MNTKQLSLGAIVLFFLTAAPALSQQDLRAMQQTACEDDAYRLCPDEIPDESRVASCMARQKARLSPGCRAMFDGPNRRKSGK